MLRRSLKFWLTLLVFYPTITQRGFASLAYPRVSVTLHAEPLQTPLNAQSELRTLRYHKVRGREDLKSILRRWGVARKTIDAMAASCQELVQARFLKPGLTIKGTFVPEDGRLTSLEVPLSEGRTLVLESSGSGAFMARIDEIPLEQRFLSHKLNIESGLAHDAENAQIPSSLVMDLSDVFGDDLDLHSSLKRGDSVRFVAEGFYLRGNLVRTGPIQAAELHMDGQILKAYRFDGQYYDETGQSLRGSMLRSPLLPCRVSSGFRVRRVGSSGRVRFHKGVDLGGASGAPVRSVGKGLVVFAGRSGAYGRLVTIQHNGVYTTLYAHLSRFGTNIVAGVTVQQGDIIGYVGQSGRATGPHLHYEVHKYGRPVNPMTVDLPSADPVPTERWTDFVKQVLTSNAWLQDHPAAQPAHPLESALAPVSVPVSSVPAVHREVPRF